MREPEVIGRRNERRKHTECMKEKSEKHNSENSWVKIGRVVDAR